VEDLTGRISARTTARGSRVSRGAFFVAGAGVGVYAVLRARRVVEAFTPDGLADRLVGLSVGLHLFGAEVRAGMAEKENEVRDRLGRTSHGDPPELSGRQPVATDVTSDTSAPTREGND
jgi:hypothetical protein